MSSQATRQSGAAVALAREIAAVEDEYRAALQAAARDLQPTKAGAAAVEGSVASGPLVELNPDAAMAIHTLETRLDQLNEIQQWAKIDPRLLRFAEGQAARHTSATASSPQQPNAPVQQGASRRSVLIPILICALALIVGWLLSLALPATVLVGR
jgi:hypothetical protein